MLLKQHIPFEKKKNCRALDQFVFHPKILKKNVLAVIEGCRRFLNQKNVRRFEGNSHLNQFIRWHDPGAHKMDFNWHALCFLILAGKSEA